MRLDHNPRLVEIIQAEIKHDESISFAKFMQHCLYHPEHGYYMSADEKFGYRGDFVTAPEISSLFGACIAQQLLEICRSNPIYAILEIGAGTGKLAADILQSLQEKSAQPKYYIYEISPSLRAAQQHYLAEKKLESYVTWLDALPDSFTGVILANEVLDALPCHLFQYADNKIVERQVTFKDETFAWVCSENLSADFATSVSAAVENLATTQPYLSEVNLQHKPWIAQLNDFLQEGVILLLDYGYGRREYYHPDRTAGTLMCFNEHQQHADPFIAIGHQDITAHVDFTAIAEMTLTSELVLSGFTTQAGFLLNCGLMNMELAENPLDRYQQQQAIKKLMLPAQMGEIIKVMALTKNFTQYLLGFTAFDRLRDL